MSKTGVFDTNYVPKPKIAIVKYSFYLQKVHNENNMFKVILGVSFFLFTFLGVYFVPLFSLSIKNEKPFAPSKIETNNGTDLSQSVNNDMEEDSIRKVISQYFILASKGKFKEISKIVVNSPKHRKTFIDVQETVETIDGKPESLIPQPNNQNNKELISESFKDSDLSLTMTKTLFPQYALRNKLSVNNIKMISLKDGESKVEVTVERRDENSLQAVYFNLIKDKQGEWRIYEVNMLDFD